MNRWLLLLLIFTGCATSQPVTQSCPSCPSIPPVIDTLRIRDTIRLDYPVYVWQDTGIPVMIDTATMIGTVMVYPSLSGDDYPTLQAALNYQATHPGTRIMLTADHYYCSHSLLFCNDVGSDYTQVKLDLEGPVDARNTSVSSTIHFTNPADFGLAIQNCKGCTIKNINMIGAYNFPSGLNAQQIDTLAFSEWPDTAYGASRTSPYAGIVIDPFSDPAFYAARSYSKMYPDYVPYYIPGMGLGGSTVIDIDHCQITNFVIGVMVTPSMQYNGEMINVSHCRIDMCKVPYAFSQAQSKANTITDLMCWGSVHTVVDGASYGFMRSDGSTSPMVDVMNCAGFIHQLFNLNAASFPISWNNVYGEGLFKLGYVWNNYAGAHFSNFQVDFQGNQPGLPTPDFWVGGGYTSFTDCMFRLYNGNPATRIVMNAPGNVFRNGEFNVLPVIRTYNPPTDVQPVFDHVRLYYQLAAQQSMPTGYDSIVFIPSTPLTIDRSSFTGYFVSTQAASCNPWDLIVYEGPYLDEFTVSGSEAIPVGYVDHVSADTVFLTNVGWGIHNGDHPDLYICKIKAL